MPRVECTMTSTLVFGMSVLPAVIHTLPHNRLGKYHLSDRMNVDKKSRFLDHLPNLSCKQPPTPLPPFNRVYLFFKCLSCGIGYCHMWSAARAAALLAAGFCCLGKNAMSRTFLSSKSRRRGVRVRENTLFEL